MTKENDVEKNNSVIVVDLHEDREGEMKCIGGSDSDDWNNTLANQTILTIWSNGTDESELDGRIRATAAAMIGITPKDELEGMMAAQLIAAHNAAMECYRRASIP